MLSKELCVVIIQFSILCICVESSCWFSSISPDENGQFPSACEYEGWTFESGASFKAPAPYCEKCWCAGGALSCCGYGKKAGIARVPGCTEVEDESTCDLQFVDSTDASLPCVPWEKKRNLENI